MTTSPLAHAAMFVIASGMMVFSLGAGKTSGQPMTTGPIRLPVEGELPSFAGATEWLNSPPLTAAGLHGRVVLVEFWTYTCINWLRTLPYVGAWAAK